MHCAVTVVIVSFNTSASILVFPFHKNVQLHVLHDNTDDRKQVLNTVGK